jgi:hypothetical protein
MLTYLIRITTVQLSFPASGSHHRAQSIDIWQLFDNLSMQSSLVAVTGVVLLAIALLVPGQCHAAAAAGGSAFPAAAALATTVTDNGSGITYWSSAVPLITFSNRYSFGGGLDQHDRMWLVGGTDNGYRNDVWLSTTMGASWSCQSCSPSAGVRFSPLLRARVFSDSTKRLYVAGGYDGMWRSSDLGVTWVSVSSASCLSEDESYIAFDNSDTLWTLTRNALWSATVASDYSTFVRRADMITPQRFWYMPLLLRSNSHIYVVGGSEAGSSIHYNDVWVADLTANPISFTRLISAAPFTPRSEPSVLRADSAGNIYLFGQFPLWFPDGPAQDVLWQSMAASSTQQLGSVWSRLDNTSCNTAWPYPVNPDPGDFIAGIDSLDRLIISAPVYLRGNPTATTASAVIQLNSDAAKVATNVAAGLHQWSTCNETAGGDSSSSSSTGGIAPPTTFSIVNVQDFGAIGTWLQSNTRGERMV